MEVPTSLAAYVRVLKLASTPEWEEFSRVALVAGAGILLIGVIGFIILLAMGLIPGV